MRDIYKLESRIKNLEYYTSLTMLESNTVNMFIRDKDGLNRFKSGFFVDNFATTSKQLKKTKVKKKKRKTFNDKKENVDLKILWKKK